MFDWADFLDLAEELATQVDDEAALRTAISRAYYAAFGAARSYLIGSGTPIPRAGAAHNVVWDHVDGLPDPVHQRIAGLGRNLRTRRRRADYDDSYADLSKHVRLALRFARKLLVDLATLP